MSAEPQTEYEHTIGFLKIQHSKLMMIEIILNLFSKMILAISCWICLITLCQSKIIEVNKEGNDSSSCCIEGACLCGSLFKALSYVKDDTVINIITSSVSLHNFTHIGFKSPSLNNITITGDGIIVMCNNSGVVVCENCTNVLVQGIIWDQCGIPDHPFLFNAVYFRASSNVVIIECTFQHSKTCGVLTISLVSGFVAVKDSKFLFNIIGNSSVCAYTSLQITNEIYTLQDTTVIISGTLFYYNGALYYGNSALYYTNSATLVCVLSSPQVQLLMHNVTISTSFGLGGNFTLLNNVDVKFSHVTFFNNSNGGSRFFILTPNTSLTISSSTYAYNNNGALKLLISGIYSIITLQGLVITGNKGTFDKDILSSNVEQGTGILMTLRVHADIIIAFCNIYDNDGKKKSSIVYLDASDFPISMTPFEYVTKTLIVSSNFINNNGSALHISGSIAFFVGHIMFMNNLAERGGAISVSYGSQILLNNVSVEFTSNIAIRQGGAIYVELLFGCPNNGLVFRELTENLSTVIFTNNSAKIAGNSIYFAVPESCSEISDPLLYKFNYSQPPELIGSPIATSPYTVNLCSTTCSNTINSRNDTNSNSCHISNGNMLGQSIGINATVCDYYGSVSATVQFYIECTNCNDTYRLSNKRILVNNGLFHISFLSVDADSDIVDNTYVTLNLFSVLSNKYKQLTATVSIDLSSCHSGYVFDQNLQQCVCYEQSKDIIQCQQDYAEIRYGYWFGITVFPKRSVSLCPIRYCDYNSNAATSNGYYKLPEELDGQCSSHRIGIACGECKPGYTLTYDSPDCINTDKCSAGMTVLVVVLTILYWIIIVALVFGLMQRKISLGYAYGLIYYYSTVDILLGSNLFITDGVFQLVTILSSFSKLTPQFLGKLCFVQGLSGIDQQFIHYFHAISIFSIIGIIVIVARWSPKIASIVSRCIIRVICLLILLSYTSLASTSLQLLRPLHFADVNGAYVYSSPSIKYFTGRHIPYGIIALLCGLFIVIGLPLLLLLEPYLKRKVNFIKIKPLLDQYQESYKDQYHWFAAYYLICRLVIIAIVYVSNFNDVLYYLQTACIIVVMIHAWIRPYKSEILNLLDGKVLLTIILIINLNSFTFSRSAITAIVVVLVILPLFMSCIIYFKIFFSSMKCTWNYKKIKKVCS